MKSVTFKRVAGLGEGEAARVFSIGTHQVPDELCQGWFFEALVKDGDIVVAADAAPAPVAVSGVSLEQAAKDVLKMLDDAADQLTDAALLDLLTQEEAGKNRQTVMAKLSEMIEARG